MSTHAEPLSGVTPALPDRSTLKRIGLGILGLGITVAAVAFGYNYWTVGRLTQSTDDAYVGGDVTAMAPHVAGFVSAIYVSDNGLVRRGQVIMTRRTLTS
jgi:membrane fusion protein, multidrug efflux system